MQIKTFGNAEKRQLERVRETRTIKNNALFFTKTYPTLFYSNWKQNEATDLRHKFK